MQQIFSIMSRTKGIASTRPTFHHPPEVLCGMIGNDSANYSPLPKGAQGNSRFLHPSTPSLMPYFLLCYVIRGVKKGDRYVSIVVGNTKRKTAVEKDKSSFAYSDVFHFLVNDSKSAVMEVFLKEDETIGHDKVVGSFKVSPPFCWMASVPHITGRRVTFTVHRSAVVLWSYPRAT